MSLIRPHSRWVRAPLRRACLGSLLALGLLGAPPDARNEPAGSAAVQLDDVKMAYLLRLASFVEWPDSTPAALAEPLLIGLIDPDPFDGGLDRLAVDRQYQGRPVRVRHVREPEDLAGCQLVFVPRDAGPRWIRPLRELRRNPVLTVGETPDFAANSGILGFYVEGDKLKLEINQDAASLAGLRLSSRLLRIARLVHGAEPESPKP